MKRSILFIVSLLFSCVLFGHTYQDGLSRIPEKAAIFSSEEDSKNEPVSTGEILTVLDSDSEAPKTRCLTRHYQGTLEVLIVDNFKAKSSKKLYKLHEAGEVYRLILPESMDKKGLVSGALVQIEGNALTTYTGGNVLQVERIEVISRPSLAPRSIGVDTRKALVLLVDFENMRASDDVSIDKLNSILYTDEQSMKANMERSSFGQVTFEPNASTSCTPDIYRVNLDMEAKHCDEDLWADEAKKAAEKMGIDLSLFQHFLFVLPHGVEDLCGFEGLGNIGCDPNCHAWVVTSDDPDNKGNRMTYTHELGHNLGMGHSSTDPNNEGEIEDEYGDEACFMGSSDAIKELNAPHRVGMHWFDQYPDSLKKVTESGEYTIYTLESGVGQSKTLVLTIKRKDGDLYTVSFRTKLGPFGSGASDYCKHVSIHRMDPQDSSENTLLIKVLKEGKKFKDEENDLKIKVLEIDDEKAKVRVRLD